MLRRDPEAIITAHIMDPDRRDLYVEGRTDRLFFEWVVGEDRHPDARILEISSVELPHIARGGERGRLLAFAQFTLDRLKTLRFFVDADNDRLLGRTVPENVWLTDYRDLEGYLLKRECFAKAIKLGISRDDIDPQIILTQVIEHGKLLGLLRLLSDLDELNLPFQNTKLARYISVEDGHVRIEWIKYLTALLQNAQISLSELSNIQSRISELQNKFNATDDLQLVHGKDAVAIFEKLLARFGVREGEGLRLLRTSYDSSFAIHHRNLSDTITYLCALRAGDSA